MHLLVSSALVVCFGLHFALPGNSWEVINDVKPYDDSGTQEDLLSQEDLIPFKASKPKPKTGPRPVAKLSVDTKFRENADAKSLKTMINPPLHHPRAGLRGEKSEVEEEELLPLGVPRRRGQRQLLQIAPRIGPTLPPEAELRRLLLRAGGSNLSTACKDVVDEDCLFFLVASADNQPPQQNNEFDFLDRPLSRHKRQNNNNNNNGNNGNNQQSDDNDDSDDTQIDDNDDSDDSLSEEGSGVSDSSSSEESLYSNHTEHVNEGQYEVPGNISVKYTKDPDEFTEKERQKYKKEFEKELEKVLNETLPGFVRVKVNKPELINGSVVSTYTVFVDGGTSANQLGEDDNLEENFFNQLDDATQPELDKIQIFGQQVDPEYGAGFVENLKTVLYDYCGSTKPCSSGGLEYDSSQCQNTGFMSGICPHKCQGYPCENKAVCELNDKFKPVCNCGKGFSGKYCQTVKKRKKKLKKAEEVGVGVAAVAGCAAFLSCMGYVLCFRKKKRDVGYTYYEDEGEMDRLSDPTSVANYCIDRPKIRTSPFPVFNPQEVFDA